MISIIVMITKRATSRATKTTGGKGMNTNSRQARESPVLGTSSPASGLLSPGEGLENACKRSFTTGGCKRSLSVDTCKRTYTIGNCKRSLTPLKSPKTRPKGTS